jgi:hypothetical protein
LTEMLRSAHEIFILAQIFLIFTKDTKLFEKQLCEQIEHRDGRDMFYWLFFYNLKCVKKSYENRISQADIFLTDCTLLYVTFGPLRNQNFRYRMLIVGMM